MLKPLHRRELFGAITAAGAGALLTRATAQAGSPASASHPRLLPGCCAYSYGKYLKNGSMTMEDFIVKAVELGVLRASKSPRIG